MKPILCGGVFHVLLLVSGLFHSSVTPAAFGQTTGSNANEYVIIKLKDGTMLEGPVLTEDDEQITINSQFANGTITRRDKVNKTDIAALSRLPDLEREQRLATMAYHDLAKYQLDPQNSYSVAYYDKVLSEVFEPFLIQYPHSTEAAMLTHRFAEWKQERDKMASGLVKHRGQWVTIAEAEKLTQAEQAQLIIQDARTLMAQGRLKAASDRLAPYYATTRPPELAADSRHLQREIYRQWISDLEALQQQLEKDLQSAKERVDRALESRTRARGNYDQANGRNQQDTGRRALGSSVMLSQASAEMMGAEKELAEAQNHRSMLQQELDNTVLTLRDIHRSADDFAAAFPTMPLANETPPPQTNAPPPPPPPPPPTVLQEIGDWFGRNWYLVAAAGLLALWGISRLFTRP